MGEGRNDRSASVPMLQLHLARCSSYGSSPLTFAVHRRGGAGNVMNALASADRYFDPQSYGHRVQGSL